MMEYEMGQNKILVHMAVQREPTQDLSVPDNPSELNTPNWPVSGEMENLVVFLKIVFIS